MKKRHFFWLSIVFIFILSAFACADPAPVPDTVPKIFGVSDAVIQIGEYIDLFEGITAKDASGKDITYDLKVSGNYDFSQEGIYQLVYSVSDKSGKTATANRKIKIVESREIQEPTAPDRNIVDGVNALGGGSFAAGNPRLPDMPKNIINLSNNLKQNPVPSSEFWTSLIIDRTNKFGDRLACNPLLVKYKANGLSIANPGRGPAGEGYDLNLEISGLSSTAAITVVDYSDFGAAVSLSDDSTCKMLTFINQGSPYVFARFSGEVSPAITGSNILGYYDSDLNAILESDGQSHTSDHIVVATKNGAVTNYFTVNAPKDTYFYKNQNKVVLSLPYGYDYVSIGAVPAENGQTPDAKAVSMSHEHGYAFVIGTYSNYDLLEDTNEVITDYYFRIWQADTEHSSDAVMVLRPNQHLKSHENFQKEYFKTIRGDTKIKLGHKFRTVDQFHGVIPSFVEPNNSEYSRDQLKLYLEDLDNGTDVTDIDTNAYNQGKRLIIIAQGILMADQIGETQIRDSLIQKLKAPLSNWLTFEASESGKTQPYLYYDSAWGTLLQRSNAFGFNNNMADHHFHLGQLVFSSAVLAGFDNEFYNNYKEMIDLMVRDYASPYRDDPMFCYMRSYDIYAGHSWASGYGDDQRGNNQESSSEALNAYAGMYLWGVVSGNEAFKKAGAYIFTTELFSTKEYWFNYSGKSFYEGYNHGSVGILWGTTIEYTTWFSSADHCKYGIQWIPTSEFLTSHVMSEHERERFGYLYDCFLSDAGDDYSWRDLAYPMRSLIDPDAVFELWGDGSGLNSMRGKCDNFTGARVYMFVNNMKTFNRRTALIWAKGANSATFYEKKDGTVVAQVWNPSDKAQEFIFTNHKGEEQKYTAPAKSLTLAQVTLEKTQAPQTPGGWNADINWVAKSNK